MIELEEALALVREKCGQQKIEIKELNQVFGYVLAQNVMADRDYPPFNRSTMDGFAIQANDLERNPKASFEIKDTVLAGELYTNHIISGNCVKIMTGAPVPEGADTVIKIEDAEVSSERVSFPDIVVSKGQNIAKQGEDRQSGELIVPTGTWCSHAVVSTLATVGKTSLKVFAKPRVNIIVTGDELKQAHELVKQEQIRDSNSWALRCLLLLSGFRASAIGIIQDDPEQLALAIKQGIEQDVLLLTGGVSMGEADYVPRLLKEAGVNQVFHNVAIKPGKPIWFGVAGNGCLVFGLPGNPFAVQVAYKILVETALLSKAGDQRSQFLILPIKETRSKRGDRAEFFPCRINTDMSLSIIPHNGSGDITAGMLSDGIALHPAHKKKLESGESLVFYPWQCPRQS